MIFDDPAACAQAALAEVAKTNRRRILLSGSLGPQWLKTLTEILHPHGLELNDPDPDPLGFEDLISQVMPSMACVIFQNPGYFGTLRDLTGLTLECREWDVPLLHLTPPTRPDLAEATKRLAHALHRLPGIRVITDDYINRFSLYLGEDVDAVDVMERLQDHGIQGCEAAGLDYPHYPELHPVLIINTPQDHDRLVQALRAALA